MKYTVYVCRSGYDAPVLETVNLSSAVASAEALITALSLDKSVCSVCIVANKMEE